MVRSASSVFSRSAFGGAHWCWAAGLPLGSAGCFKKSSELLLLAGSIHFVGFHEVSQTIDHVKGIAILKVQFLRKNNGKLDFFRYF